MNWVKGALKAIEPRHKAHHGSSVVSSSPRFFAVFSLVFSFSLEPSRTMVVYVEILKNLLLCFFN